MMTDDSSISTLHLSRRSVNCLARAQITTVDALRRYKNADLLDIQGFGRTCLREVRRKLKEADEASARERMGANPVSAAPQVPVATQKEECGVCFYGRENGNPATVNCHEDSPQIRFKEFPNRLVHEGFWPTVDRVEWCGRFRPKGA